MNDDKNLNKNQKKEPVLKSLTDKFRVVFLDNESYEEKGSIVFSRLSIIIYFHPLQICPS